MSASPGAAGKADKGMSNRLMTMKFMQRAAASAASKESESPSSSPAPAGNGQKHSPKRQRMSRESSAQSDQAAIAAAIAAEEEKRRQAVARQAAEAGESQWVLNIPAAAPRTQPYIMAADSLDADDLNGGRRAFGNFKRKQNTQSFQPTDGDDETANGASRSRHGQASRGASLKDLKSISGGGGRGQSMGTPPQKKKKRKSGQGH